VERAHFVVTTELPGDAMGLLGAAGDVWAPPANAPLEPAELRRAAAGATALVTLLGDRVDEELLDAAGPQLRVVANVAVGYDNIDVDAARSRGVIVTNTPGVLTDATADLAMALILALTRRIGEGERLLREGRDWRWGLGFMLGRGIQDRELGIVGLGAIGAAVARRARAFGMRISYAGPRPAAAAAVQELGAARRSLPELLESADVVTIHAPLRPDTRRLIGARELTMMKPGAYLVNTARGQIVDEQALVAALAAGEIAGAGLDVFESEPRVHPSLLGMENVVLLPHLGSATVETRAAMAELAARNAVAVAAGRAALTPVT